MTSSYDSYAWEYHQYFRNKYPPSEPENKKECKDFAHFFKIPCRRLHLRTAGPRPGNPSAVRNILTRKLRNDPPSPCVTVLRKNMQSLSDTRASAAILAVVNRTERGPGEAPRLRHSRHLRCTPSNHSMQPSHAVVSSVTAPVGLITANPYVRKARRKERCMSRARRVGRRTNGIGIPPLRLRIPGCIPQHESSFPVGEGTGKAFKTSRQLSCGQKRRIYTLIRRKYK